MPTRVTVCGAGTVGSAVLKLLAQAGDAYSVSCGTDVNLAKERPFDKNVYTMTASVDDVMADEPSWTPPGSTSRPPCAGPSRSDGRWTLRSRAPSLELSG